MCEFAIVKDGGMVLDDWLAAIASEPEADRVRSRYLRPMWATDWPPAGDTAAQIGRDRLEFVDGAAEVKNPCGATLMVMERMARSVGGTVVPVSPGYFGLDGSYLGLAG